MDREISYEYEFHYLLLKESIYIGGLVLSLSPIETHNATG